MFIYCIENLLNHKKYIGKTIHTIQERFKAHKRKMKNKKRNHLHSAMVKDGIENFIIYEIDVAKNTEDELNQKEKHWIKTLDTKNNGYNETDGGEGISGFKYTNEQKKAVSERQKRYFANWTDEQRNEHAKKTTDHWNSLSEEEKNRRSEIYRQKAIGNQHAKGNKFNVVHSPEHCRKIGLARLGAKGHQNQITKITEMNLINNPMNNPETKEKHKMACRLAWIKRKAT